MNVVRRKYDHYLNIPVPIDLSKKDSYNLFIVYYINCCMNPNYFDWLTNQINLVKYMNAPIYIIATTTNEVEFKHQVLQLYPNVIIECYSENEYEYRGILKVWELGQLHNQPNDIVLYFHSKGVTRSKKYKRKTHAMYDYTSILDDIDKIKEIFDIFPTIDKIGILSGGIGWIWYNFWFARGSYIYTVEKPLKTTRRHYYEEWLGRSTQETSDTERSYHHYKNTLHNCYSLYTDKKKCSNIGMYYYPEKNKICLISKVHL